MAAKFFSMLLVLFMMRQCRNHGTAEVRAWRLFAFNGSVCVSTTEQICTRSIVWNHSGLQPQRTHPSTKGKWFEVGSL